MGKAGGWGEKERKLESWPEMKERSPRANFVPQPDLAGRPYFALRKEEKKKKKKKKAGPCVSAEVSTST